jgi:hypothetical protein
VEALFARVRAAEGRLDLLVNNAWGGYERYGEASFDAPFRERPAWRADAMWSAGVRAQMTAARLAAQLMLARRAGLIVSTVAWAYDRSLGCLPYDVAKAAVVRMVFGMAEELRPHGVGAMAVAPGFMRTERVMAEHAARPFDLSPTETPAFVARAVAALAEDADVLARSGGCFTAGDLAREYGFTDVDVRRPPGFRLPATPPRRAEPRLEGGTVATLRREVRRCRTPANRRDCDARRCRAGLAAGAHAVAVSACARAGTALACPPSSIRFRRHRRAPHPCRAVSSFVSRPPSSCWRPSPAASPETAAPWPTTRAWRGLGGTAPRPPPRSRSGSTARATA